LDSRDGLRLDLLDALALQSEQSPDLDVRVLAVVGHV
jgi:hypothetical protein